MLPCLDSDSAQRFRLCLQENVTTINCQNVCSVPGGHSLVNLALMIAVASSGKTNLLFFQRYCLVVLLVSSVVSLFFMLFQALQSLLFQPLPSLNLHLPCLTRVLTLSLFYHHSYLHIFSAGVKQSSLLADYMYWCTEQPYGEKNIYSFLLASKDVLKTHLVTCGYVLLQWHNIFSFSVS